MSLIPGVEDRKLTLNQRRGSGARRRGMKTKDRIVAAARELMEEGNPTPSAAEVAERANYSPRTVFACFKPLGVAGARLEAYKTDPTLCRTVARRICTMMKVALPPEPDPSLELSGAHAALEELLGRIGPFLAEYHNK